MKYSMNKIGYFNYNISKLLIIVFLIIIVFYLDYISFILSTYFFLSIYLPQTISFIVNMNISLAMKANILVKERQASKTLDKEIKCLDLKVTVVKYAAGSAVSTC